MAGIYAANGSINVTVVDGTARTGLYAADGSWNVVVATGLTPVGAYHPCGALWVTPVFSITTPLPFRAPDGSMYVVDGTTSGKSVASGQPVTVVSGSLFAVTGTGFLLLVDGVSFLLLVDGTSKLDLII